ncbi:MAG: hypothetical protein LQ338_004506 [Usnochroma carphineum]|nr:MAG: hypothetical protein LQ338_004506 [Usnochroma carphineum]
MASPTTITRICLGLGITTSSFLAGALYTCSSLAIPAILTAPSPSPSILLRQWHNLFTNGKKLGPAIAILGAVNYLYVAWGAYNSTYERGLWKTYVGAAACTLGIVPYTFLVMGATNQQLLAQTAQLTISEVEVRALVERWGFLNLVRAGIPVVGTALGLWGAL